MNLRKKTSIITILGLIVLVILLFASHYPTKSRNRYAFMNQLYSKIVDMQRISTIISSSDGGRNNFNLDKLDDLLRESSELLNNGKNFVDKNIPNSTPFSGFGALANTLDNQTLKEANSSTHITNESSSLTQDLFYALSQDLSDLKSQLTDVHGTQFNENLTLNDISKEIQLFNERWTVEYIDSLSR